MLMQFYNMISFDDVFTTNYARQRLISLWLKLVRMVGSSRPLLFQGGDTGEVNIYPLCLSPLEKGETSGSALRVAGSPPEADKLPLAEIFYEF
jgi:hypothetical protein